MRVRSTHQVIGVFLMGICLSGFSCAAAAGTDDPGQPSTTPIVVRAHFHVDENTHNGTLIVTAEIRDDHHIYAMTQPKPYIASQIEVDASSRVQLTKGFMQAQQADVAVDEFGDELHKHKGRAQWVAHFELPEHATDPNALEISGHLYAQACSSNGCLMPTRYPFRANFRPDALAGTLPLTDTAAETDARAPSQQLANSSTSGTESVQQDEGVPQAQSIPRSHDDLASTRAIHSATSSDADEPESLDLQQLQIGDAPAKHFSWAAVIPMAFFAGLILNFMPCVLPVIGLKVMSFAQQSGDRRGRVFLLNVWYATGVISVFLILATLAVVLGFGWGQQFSSVPFNIVLAATVFVFALSFLGIWEIPIPGFVGSSVAGAIAEREGLTGALAKGILTTVLATPCSGPMLGPALTWATSQSPLLTYIVFGSVGLGMSSPYLVIGAFPKLIGFLPKPGEWMNTFKHVMGFVLLATVVYIMSFIPVSFVVPFLAFMVGLWAACWWIGRVPLTEHWDKLGATWIQAVAVALVIGFVSFGWLHRVMDHRLQQTLDRELSKLAQGSESHLAGRLVSHQTSAGQTRELPWKPYTHETLRSLTAQGKTVLVDFTADWCLTCKANESVALNTSEMKQFVSSHGIETLKADKTSPSPEVDELLMALGNKGRAIPFYAIFPAGKPNNPILLDGVFTSSKPILQALRTAGASATGKNVITR